MKFAMIWSHRLTACFTVESSAVASREWPWGWLSLL